MIDVTAARRALGCCALLALLGGCGTGGASPVAPLQAGVARVDATPLAANVSIARLGDSRAAAVRGLNAGHRHSWAAPSAKRQNLMYVSDTETNEVDFLTYPRGQLVGAVEELNDPQGLCSDKKGNVFIANTGSSNVVEFPHGGTNVVTILNDPNEYPSSCAVDPVTGNLAVANVVATDGSWGNVVVYAKAAGKPKSYSVTGIERPYFAGYDNKGNLYVDGQTSSVSGGFGLSKLAVRGRIFKPVSLNQAITYPGAVQWDGEYLSVGDQNANAIYQFAISGFKGKLAGTTQIPNVRDVIQWWIVRYGTTRPQANGLIAPDEPTPQVGVYAYPKGTARNIFTTGFYHPTGSTFSIGPKP